MDENQKIKKVLAMLEDQRQSSKKVADELPEKDRVMKNYYEGFSFALDYAIKLVKTCIE